MAVYICSDCANVYDEDKEGVPFADLFASWVCPVCGAPKSAFERRAEDAGAGDADSGSPLEKTRDDVEEWMADIIKMAETGKSLDEAMRTRKPVISWDDILFLGSQLARAPLLSDDSVVTKTIIGPSWVSP